MRYLIVFLCFFILNPGTCVRAQSTNEALLLDSLRTKLQSIADRDELPGFAVALVDADGIIFEEGYGYADLETKKPYTPATVQNIGSISKTFIGISLLQAEKAGILSLDDPINKHLPFKVIHPRFPDQPILLRHLAHHTSGISDAKNYDAAYSLLESFTADKKSVPKSEYKEILVASRNKRMELGDFMENFFTPGKALFHKKNFNKHAPGEKHEYSNVGAALAAYVLESASGMPFPEWTQKYIFDPIDMRNTGWFVKDIDPATYFTHHFANGVKMPDYTLSTYPDGGLLTSIHQLGLYTSAAIAGRVSGNQVLSAEDYSRLIDDAFPVPEEDSSYGIYWEDRDDGLYGHTGGDPGITTIMFINKENGVGQLAFLNGTPKSGDFIREVVVALIRCGKRLRG